MADLWGPHEPAWQGDPPPEYRSAEALHKLIALHKKDGTKPTEWDMISALSGALIDLEIRVVQMKRRLDELGESES